MEELKDVKQSKITRKKSKAYSLYKEPIGYIYWL